MSALCLPTRCRGFLAALVGVALLAAPAAAQEDMEDIFGGLGTVSEAERKAAEEELAEGEGSLVGRVFDRDNAQPISGVTVVVVFPPPPGGGEPLQDVRTTGPGGDYEFGALPAGTYSISFIKAGFQASTMTGFEVVAGQENRADFPLAAVATTAGGDVLDLDEFVVEAETVGEMMTALELRMDADQMLDVMSAEDFSKYAASDVAEALKRVAGINIVEGQFAIIRGLEDRYSSTLFNGAVVPSPDPDRQSVQLDLFPSEIVTNLAVSKTFTNQLPSNSSGGSIDILTNGYPEEPFFFSLKGGTGFNTNAIDGFLRFDRGSAFGKEIDGTDTMDKEFGAFAGGTQTLAGRELRFKGLYNTDTDYKTGEGFEEKREPRTSQFRRFPRPGVYTRSGDLSLGQLNLTGGRFDLTSSTREWQRAAFGGLGFDVDKTGNHAIDFTAFWTEKETELVEAGDDGYLPGMDYQKLANAQANGQQINSSADYQDFATISSWVARNVRADPGTAPSDGQLWYAPVATSESFLTERDLQIYQFNGDHKVDELEGDLHISWAANYAESTQQEEFFGVNYFFEPANPFQNPGVGPNATEPPISIDSLGPGEYVANAGVRVSDNDIDETSGFIRIDADYEITVAERFRFGLNGGYWWERANRDVLSNFLENATVSGNGQFAITAATPRRLGEAVVQELDKDPTGLFEGTRTTTNDSERKIDAWHLGVKSTFFDRLDVMGGVRHEDIDIESNNDPYTGEPALDTSPGIFPNKWVFLDCLDNVFRNEVVQPPAPGTTYNDQLVGIKVPSGPCRDLAGVPVTGSCVDLIDRGEIDAFVNGEIDEEKWLPFAAFTIRPIPGLTLRGAWSETVARPSFRELGFYVSVDPSTDDLVLGNPQLQLSEVTSWDVRAEYVWGEVGDLVGVSFFRKDIEDPIESIVIRDPINLTPQGAQFRTFFNNPDSADLDGVEAELRKNLGFTRIPFSEYFSIGGNYTYIDAEVERSPVERPRTARFFGVAPGDTAQFNRLSKKRRLFGQPEWIANADITFDHPGWGTKITLAAFGISDVLDAAGSATLNAAGQTIAYTPDRYLDQYYTLDLIASQRIPLWMGELSFKFSAKNLTDTQRKIIYDPDQVQKKIRRRGERFGVDLSFGLSYSLSF